MFEKTIYIPESTSDKVWKRTACRWVVVDDNGQIPLVYDSYMRYYKLPGWWMEWEEDKIESFKREISEEAWCEIDSIEEVWKVIEKNSKWEQTSYCFFWKIISKWESHFTQKEIDRGYKLIWVKFEEALPLIENEQPRDEGGLIMKERESFILWEIMKLKNGK